MSDDSKDKTDKTAGDGAGAKSGTSKDSSGDDATKVGFGELFGYIDERIKSALGKSDSSGKDAGATGAGDESPQSMAEQIRQEIAKLSGEKAAADKDAARDVSIQELKERMDKISEEKPEEKVSKLTEIMWGKRK